MVLGQWVFGGDLCLVLSLVSLAPALRSLSAPGRKEGETPALPLSSPLHWQNLQISGLKQMTSLWFPELTTQHAGAQTPVVGALVPGVSPGPAYPIPQRMARRQVQHQVRGM